MHFSEIFLNFSLQDLRQNAYRGVGKSKVIIRLIVNWKNIKADDGNHQKLLNISLIPIAKLHVQI